jgi:general secretion pathway protein F
MNALPPNSFRCVALDKQGRPQELRLVAGSEAEAVAQLSAKGLTPVLITQRGPSLMEQLSQPVQFGNRVVGGDLTGLTDRLALLLKAGLTLSQALELEANSIGRTSVLALAKRLEDQIKAGRSFASALSQEKFIPPYYVGVVQAAERGGRLAQGLADLAATMKLADQTRSQLVSTLSYPVIVLVSTVLALLFVLIYVIPNFQTLFEGEEARLPLMTQGVLALSGLVNRYGWELLLGGAVTIFLAWRFMRSQMFERWWQHRLASRSSLFDLIRTFHTGRILRVLGTQVNNGVPLPDAMASAGAAASARSYALFLRDAERRVREGQSLSAICRASPLLPPTATKLIEVGEAGGTLGAMMLQAAELFETQGRLRLERLVAIANPLAVIVLGGLVAILIASVMIGIFSIQGLAL